MCLTPRGPVSVCFFSRATKKAYNWESAEVIVGICTHTKGPNVTVARIATSNVWIVSNQGYVYN